MNSTNLACRYKNVNIIMSTKEHIGPESPADPEGSQGAKNLRMQIHGTPEGDTNYKCDDGRTGTKGTLKGDTMDKVLGMSTRDTNTGTTGTPKGDTLDNIWKFPFPTDNEEVTCHGPPNVGETSTCLYGTSNDDSKDVTEAEIQTNCEEVFSRKPLIFRTPPKRNDLEVWNRRALRSASEGDIFYSPTSIEMDDRSLVYNILDVSGLDNHKTKDSDVKTYMDVESDERPTNKRKREGTPPHKVNLTLETYQSLLAALNECSEDLYGLAQKHTKTQKDMKEKITQLRKLVKNVCKAGNEAITTVPTSTKPIENRNVETQVDADDIDKKVEQTRKAHENQIRDTLKSKEDYDSLTDIIDLKWPKDVFTKTRVEYGQIPLNEQGDTVFIISPDTKPDEVNIIRLTQGCPELLELLNEGLEEGKVEYVQSKTATTCSRGGIKETIRMTYVLPYKMEDKDIVELKSLYNLLKNLKRVVEEFKAEKLVIPLAGPHNMSYLRKCLEFLFQHQNINLILLLADRSRPKPEALASKDRTNNKIIIKSGGRAYADLLKTVKSSVDINEVGVNIQRVKKTVKGDLLLEVGGGTEYSEKLKETLKKKVPEFNLVTVRNQNKEVIYITNIDGDLDSTHVKETILKLVPSVDEAGLTILQMKSNEHGSQTATVAVDKRAAAELVKMGKIEIGWSRCTVRYRATVVRCFRCLEFGHRSSECSGVERRDVCLKCGIKGHKAKECVNESFCFVCKREGHRTDQTKCPRFKELIKQKVREMEDKIKGKRGTRRESERERGYGTQL